jgi:hypothetical protein
MEPTAPDGVSPEDHQSMITKLPAIHPKWLTRIKTRKFRSKLAEMLDSRMGGEGLFEQAVPSLEDFSALMVMHGMQDAVPKDMLKTVLKRDDVKGVKVQKALTKLAAESDHDDYSCALAVLAMSRGIETVSFYYWGGTDEIDLTDHMNFSCVDTATEKKALGIWKVICEGNGRNVDDLFWAFNSDSGAGCGTCYSNDLTITLLTLSAVEGEAEYEEDDDDYQENDE